MAVFADLKLKKIDASGGPSVGVSSEGCGVVCCDAMPHKGFLLRRHNRKKSGDGIASILKSALQGCSLLESDPVLAGRLPFRKDELLIVTNDRLLAPNNDQTFDALKPELSAALKLVFSDGKFTLTRSSTNPKERFAVRVQTGLPS